MEKNIGDKKELIKNGSLSGRNHFLQNTSHMTICLQEKIIIKRWARIKHSVEDEFGSGHFPYKSRVLWISSEHIEEVENLVLVHDGHVRVAYCAFHRLEYIFGGGLQYFTFE